MDVEQLMSESRPFVAWLGHWVNDRPALPLAGAIAQAGGPQHVAVLATDVITGFCSQGALASPRVGGIVAPVVRLFRDAHRLGVRHFVLTQDTHTENAVEFGSYPPHCVRGTDESEMVPELKSLPFSDLFVVLPKNSINPAQDTGLDAWLEQHPEVTTFFVTGDCTDICVHQLSLHVRVRANARDLRGVRVIVPIDCVDTYDLPVDVAVEQGILPHPADLLHHVFLHSMALNGVEVVGRVEA
jgi:nicotinamidase-related amidase